MELKSDLDMPHFIIMAISSVAWIMIFDFRGHIPISDLPPFTP
jgi:hypothetical protein